VGRTIEHRAERQVTPSPRAAGVAPTQPETKIPDELNPGRDGVIAAVEIPETDEPLDDESEEKEQPGHQQAVRVMGADVFQAVVSLCLVEPLVLHGRAATVSGGAAFGNPQAPAGARHRFACGQSRSLLVLLNVLLKG